MISLALLVTLVVGVRGQCSDNQTSVASNLFKDCMDQRQAALLQTNLEAEPSLSVFCEGLEQFSGGCTEAVEGFARCKSQEYVENLLDIHIQSMAGETRIKIRDNNEENTMNNKSFQIC